MEVQREAKTPPGPLHGNPVSGQPELKNQLEPNKGREPLAFPGKTDADQLELKNQL